jgi:hypothetical protein
MKKSLRQASVRTTALLAVLAAAGVLGGCNDDDDVVLVAPGILFAITEVEPANDVAATATPLNANQAGQGSLDTAGDVDHWSFAGTAGTVLRAEIFGVRFDQATWDANDNVPRLSLLGVDGVTVLLSHDYSGNAFPNMNSWSWGKHDLDIEAFRLPSTGVYTLRLTQDDTTSAGGDYVLAWSIVDLGPVQDEVEATGTTGVNDTIATAQSMSPGVVHGFHVDNESDFYSFVVTEPSIVSFETKSYRNGIADGDDYYDVEISLRDVDGATEIDNDDDTYFYDSGIDTVLSAPGTYYLEVLECCGDGDAPYLLVFKRTPLGAGSETEPNDAFGTAGAIFYDAIVSATAEGATQEDWFSFVGAAGDQVFVQVFSGSLYFPSGASVSTSFVASDGATPLPSDSSSGLGIRGTILTASGTFFVRVVQNGTGPYALRLTRPRAGDFEVEPNDGPGAPASAVPGRAGVILTMNDRDDFAFSAEAGQVVRVAIFAQDGDQSDGFFDSSATGSVLAPVIGIRNSSDVLLAMSPYSGVNTSTEGVVVGDSCAGVTFVAPSTGVFNVDVSAEFMDFGADRTYLIWIR